MRFPIDTSEMAFQVVSRPEPLRDPTSGRARTTREGVPLFMVQLLTSWQGTVGTIAVEVAREPSADIRPGVIVHVIGLAALSWTTGTRSGLVLRAQRIESVDQMT
jgi:hypothetical protein